MSCGACGNQKAPTCNSKNVTLSNELSSKMMLCDAKEGIKKMQYDIGNKSLFINCSNNERNTLQLNDYDSDACKIQHIDNVKGKYDTCFLYDSSKASSNMLHAVNENYDKLNKVCSNIVYYDGGSEEMKKNRITSKWFEA